MYIDWCDTLPVMHMNNPNKLTYLLTVTAVALWRERLNTLVASQRKPFNYLTEQTLQAQVHFTASSINN